jgi:hypothetical protein
MEDFKKHNFAKIKNLETGVSYIQPPNMLRDAFDGEFDGAASGDKWEITLIRMTEAEFDELPEFEGY